MSIAFIQYEGMPCLHIVAEGSRVTLDLRDECVNVLIELRSKEEVEKLARQCALYLADHPSVYVPTFG